VDDELPERCRVHAWRPAVPGVAEVFHARLVDYAYPRHAHDTWTVLIVDAGTIRYDLDTRRAHVVGDTVAVLPPGVVHDGGPAPGTHGFRKRTLYLDAEFLPLGLVGPAVDQTTLADRPLRAALARVHEALVADDHGDRALDAEARLALVAERLAARLAPAGPSAPPPPPRPEGGVADRLRELLDARVAEPITLREAAAVLDRSVPHLVRSFTRRFGVSPHAYLVGRRIEAARRRLLAGERPADVAVAVGFHDQSHLTRHFRRHASVPPGEFARSRRA